MKIEGKMQVILIKQILYFLEIEDLINFSLICKSGNETYKIHIQLRINKEIEDIKLLENKNVAFAKSIHLKRKQYF